MSVHNFTTEIIQYHQQRLIMKGHYTSVRGCHCRIISQVRTLFHYLSDVSTSFLSSACKFRCTWIVFCLFLPPFSSWCVYSKLKSLFCYLFNSEVEMMPSTTKYWNFWYTFLYMWIWKDRHLMRHHYIFNHHKRGNYKGSKNFMAYFAVTLEFWANPVIFIFYTREFICE